MEPLPPTVRSLLDRHLRSMEHVEVLVFLADHAPQPVSLDEIGKAIHAAAGLVSGILDDLRGSGLVEPDGAESQFRFAPARAGDRTAVADLSMMYHQRPVTLVRAVYDRPANTPLSFTDEFDLDNPKGSGT